MLFPPFLEGKILKKVQKQLLCFCVPGVLKYLNSESPPSVKKVVVPEFTLDHVYQSNPVQSKAELEH